MLTQREILSFAVSLGVTCSAYCLSCLLVIAVTTGWSACPSNTPFIFPHPVQLRSVPFGSPPGKQYEQWFGLWAVYRSIMCLGTAEDNGKRRPRQRMPAGLCKSGIRSDRVYAAFFKVRRRMKTTPAAPIPMRSMVPGSGTAGPPFMPSADITTNVVI